MLAPAASAAETSALARANALWEQGEYAQAEKMYAAAIQGGSLQPDELVQAWAREGACLAYAGKKQAATDAFRNAAVLNPTFSVPDEVGPKAVAAAKPARAQASALGDFSLRAEVPKSATEGETWGWSAQIDSAHASLVSRVSARWSAAGAAATETTEKPGAERISFLSTKAVPAGAKLLELRLSALDKRGNVMKWVVVSVPVSARAAAPVVANAGAAQGPASPTAKPSGFWHSPWPWVIGGAALAAGAGTAYYYYGMRTPPDVNIEAPKISPAN